MRAWLVLVTACAGSAPTLAPIIDVPTNVGAVASGNFDTLDMAVAHQGAADGDNIASKTFTRGQTVELGGVPFAADLVVHLSGLDANGGEVAYGRTCSFPIAQNTALPSPHLYFARDVKFGQLAVVPEARSGGSAITYHDGSGLLIGGVDPQSPTTPVSDIERFDPHTGELRYLATAAPRLDGVSAVVGTGTNSEIAILGGIDPTTGVGAEFVEIVEADASVDRRVDTVPSPMGRLGVTATTLTDGSVLVFGGADVATNMPSNEVDEITLTNGTAQVQQLHPVLATARYKHTATRLGNDLGAPVLVVGGLDMNGNPIAQAELYKPLSQAFSSVTYPMQVPRSGHQAVRMPDGSVLIIGGRARIGMPGVIAPTADLEVFTQDGGFVLNGKMPTSAGLTDFTVTTLPDGRVLLTGGLDFNGNPTNTAFIARLDPITGSVEVDPTDRMFVARAGHQATLLCDGTVLISGGTTSPMVIERYNPPAAGRR